MNLKNKRRAIKFDLVFEKNKIIFIVFALLTFTINISIFQFSINYLCSFISVKEKKTKKFPLSVCQVKIKQIINTCHGLDPN